METPESCLRIAEALEEMARYLSVGAERDELLERARQRRTHAERLAEAAGPDQPQA